MTAGEGWAGPHPSRPWYHFAGIAGSGMSALAQFHALGGGRTSGSDRAFDQGQLPQIRDRLGQLGIAICRQDGRGLRAGCTALIVSTAVENEVPDVLAARRLGIPILHRSELLARYVQQHRTIAVAGTSGKSTVVAMIFTILQGTGHDPSLLTGGPLLALERQGYLGNAWTGGGDLLVAEADESDGSLVRYEPWAGVLLNLRLDHKEPREIAAMFKTFRDRTRGPFLVGEDANLESFAAGATRFGYGESCAIRAREVACDRRGTVFTVDEISFTLPVPGAHNVQNAVAAIAACRAAGVPLADMVQPLSRFAGVTRRFQTVGVANGIEIIDDFAHNPDKIAAALSAAQARSERVLAVFQPHGYGPTRFLKEALIEVFARRLRPQDRLWLPEIYYAGGSVTRDISSADISEGVMRGGRAACYLERRQDVPAAVSTSARPGDLVLVMGARDPSLTDLCRQILQRLQECA